MPAWLLLLPLSLAPTAVVDAAARSELRWRTPGDSSPEGARDNSTWEVELGAAGGLELRYPRSTLRFGYSPGLTVRNLTEEAAGDVLHQGELSLHHRWQRATLSSSYRATYGERRFSAVEASPAVEARPVLETESGGDQGDTGADASTPVLGSPTVLGFQRSVRSISHDTQISLALGLSARTSLTLRGGYAVSTGLGDDRARLPYTHGPNAAARLGYGATARDWLETELSGSTTFTEIESDPGRPSPRRSTTLLGVRESWRHRLGPHSHSTVYAGVSFAPGGVGQDNDLFLGLLLGGAYSYLHLLEGNGTIAFDAALDHDVAVERLTGQADPRVRASLGATWQKQATTSQLSFAQARSLGARDDSLRITTAELVLRRSMMEVFLLSLGGRVADTRLRRQSVATSSVRTGPEWVVFIGAGLALGPWLLQSTGGSGGE